MRAPFLAPCGWFNVPARGGFVLLYRNPVRVEIIAPSAEDRGSFDRRGFSHQRRPWPGLPLGCVVPDLVAETPYHKNLPTYRLDLDDWFERGDGTHLVLNYYVHESYRDDSCHGFRLHDPGDFLGCAWIQRNSELTVGYAALPGDSPRLYFQADGSPAQRPVSGFFRKPSPLQVLPAPAPLLWLSQHSYRPGQSIWGCVWIRKRASDRGWDLQPPESTSLNGLPFCNEDHRIALEARVIAPGMWEVCGKIPDHQALGEYTFSWKLAGRRETLQVVSSDGGPLSLELQAENTPAGLLLHFRLPQLALGSAPQTVQYRVSPLAADHRSLPTYRDFTFDTFHSPGELAQAGELSLAEAQGQALLLGWQRPPEGAVLQVEANWGSSRAVCRLQYPSPRPRLGLKLVHLAAPGEESLVEVVVSDGLGRPLPGIPIKIGFPECTSVKVESREGPVTVPVTAPLTWDGNTLQAEILAPEGCPVRTLLSFPRVPPSLTLPLPLQVELDRASYQVGDTALLKVGCGAARARGALRIWSGGLLEHRWLHWEGEELTIPLQVALEHAPGFQIEVSLFGLTDHGLQGHWRVIEARVEQPQRHLQIHLRLAYPVLKSGQQQRAQVEVQDDQGRPVPGARIALCAADARAASRLPGPVEHFYGSQPYRGQVVTSWQNTPLQHPSEMEQTYRQDQVNLAYCDQPERGIGTGSGSPPPRSDFAATAFCSAELISDENGQARIDFPAGDRLAPFLVTVVVVSPNQAWGTARAGYEVTRGITLHAVLPLYLRTGDRLRLPVLLGNSGHSPQQVQLGLTIDGPLSCSRSDFEYHLAEGSGAEVLFELSARQPGMARLGLLATSPTEIDQLEFPLEVLENQAQDIFASVDWCRGQAGGQQTQRRRDFLPPKLAPCQRMEMLRSHLAVSETQFNFRAVLNNCLEVAYWNGTDPQEWAGRLQELVEFVASGCPRGGDLARKVHRAEVLWTAHFCAALRPEFARCWELAEQFLNSVPLEPPLLAWEVLMERPGALSRFESQLDTLVRELDGSSRGQVQEPTWTYPSALLALLKINRRHPLLPTLLWATWEGSFPKYAVGDWIWRLARAQIKAGVLLEQTLVKPALTRDSTIDQGMSLELNLTGLVREGNLVRGRVGQRVALQITLSKHETNRPFLCTCALPAGLELQPAPARQLHPLLRYFRPERTDYVDRVEFEMREILLGTFLETSLDLQLVGILKVPGSFQWPGVRIHQLDRPSCWGATADLHLEVTGAN